MTTPPPTTDNHPAWWGSTQIAVGQVMAWHLGPLRLWVERQPHAWRIAHLRGTDPLDPNLHGGQLVDADAIDEGAESARFGVNDDEPGFELAPRLADRPVVIRPDHPFHLPAGEDITLFVSSSIWVVASTTPPQREVTEIPIYRPSDTWFGSTFDDGELCYASRTGCRLRIEDLPILPHRCVTRVNLRNRASSQLTLERLKLPLNQLALFADPQQRLWTQDLTMVRHETGEHARVTIDRTPTLAADALRLAAPRLPHQDNAMVRAFSTLFS